MKYTIFIEVYQIVDERFLSFPKRSSIAYRLSICVSKSDHFSVERVKIFFTIYQEEKKHTFIRDRNTGTFVITIVRNCLNYFFQKLRFKKTEGENS